MYAHAPATTEAGMRDAYSSVSRELGAAAHRIVAVPLDQYQKHGATGYLSSLASGTLRTHTAPHPHTVLTRMCVQECRWQSCDQSSE
jgi:hypothetical protein